MSRKQGCLRDCDYPSARLFSSSHTELTPMKHELRKTFATLFLVLCLCLTAGLFASCRQPTEAIQIASVLPLTGPAGELGQDIKRGHELAAEYFNGRPERTRQVQFV